MKTALKSLGLCILFLLALSLTVDNKPLFSYVYEVISPGTKIAQNATQEFLKRSVKNTQTYSKKLFDNSVPRARDAVKPTFFVSQNLEVEHPAEKITDEEKSQLENLIKNH
jgi:hypothetical protein